MKKSSKFLPQLNQLYLQKQSYLTHKKKIHEIFTKKTKSMSFVTDHRISQNVSLKQSRVGLVNKQSLRQLSFDGGTRLEKSRSLSKSVCRLAPYEKLKIQQQIKEDERSKRRMQNGKSQLRRTKFQKEYEKYDRIKRQLMRYEVNPQSLKTELKSEKSLNSISQRILIQKKRQVYCGSLIGDRFENKKKAYMFRGSYETCVKKGLGVERKELNFSSFIKRAYEMKPKQFGGKVQRMSLRSKLINYERISQNLSKYENKGRVGVNSRSLNQKQKYFALTEIDV